MSVPVPPDSKAMRQAQRQAVAQNLHPICTSFLMANLPPTLAIGALTQLSGQLYAQLTHVWMETWSNEDQASAIQEALAKTEITTSINIPMRPKKRRQTNGA